MSTKMSKKQKFGSTSEKRPAKRKNIMSLAEYEAGAKAKKKTVPGGAGSKAPAEPPKGRDRPRKDRHTQTSRHLARSGWPGRRGQGAGRGR